MVKKFIARPRLCHHDPQEPRFGSSRDNPDANSALRHAAAESSLHGVTRGKRLIVLIGQKKAVAIAVRNVSGRRRWSKLAEWLCPGSPISRRNHVEFAKSVS